MNSQEAINAIEEYGKMCSQVRWASRYMAGIIRNNLQNFEIPKDVLVDLKRELRRFDCGTRKWK